MRLHFFKDKDNPRAENRRAWIVLFLALAALILSSIFPVTREEILTYAPVKADDSVVTWRGNMPVIDLNRADISTLMELPGIGPYRAEAIVHYREKNGPFTSVGALLEVAEIPKKVFDSIIGNLRVD